MDLKSRKNINKAVFMWVVVALLLLIMATPALSTLFAAPGSVNTKAIVNGAVKAKKIATGAVNSAKITDGSIKNADIAAAAAIAASKINRTGLNADLLDGKEAGDFVGKTGDQSMTGALTATGLNYASPQTRYLSIPASAFDIADPAVTYTIDSAGDYLYSTAGGWNVFRAAVNLPDGATVTNFRMIAWDSLAGNYSQAKLIRWSAGAGSQELAHAQTDNLTDAVWKNYDDVSIANSAIDNSAYNYFVKFWHGNSTNNNIRLGGIIITFTVPKP